MSALSKKKKKGAQILEEKVAPLDTSLGDLLGSQVIEQREEAKAHEARLQRFKRDTEARLTGDLVTAEIDFFKLSKYDPEGKKRYHEKQIKEKAHAEELAEKLLDSENTPQKEVIEEDISPDRTLPPRIFSSKSNNL